MTKTAKKSIRRVSDSRKTPTAGYPETNPKNKEQANKLFPRRKKSVKKSSGK